MSDSYTSVTTKKGDKGDTSLFDGTLVRKDYFLIEILGEIDELCSWLGLIRIELKDMIDVQDDQFIKIQRVLDNISTEVASSDIEEAAPDATNVEEENIVYLEKIAKKLLQKTGIKPAFCRPNNSLSASKIDIARAICRRVERRVVSILDNRQHAWLLYAVKYLNRLSDYLFILSRHIDQNS